MKKYIISTMFMFIFLPCILILSACGYTPISMDKDFYVSYAMPSGDIYKVYYVDNNILMLYPDNATAVYFTDGDYYYYDGEIWNKEIITQTEYKEMKYEALGILFLDDVKVNFGIRAENLIKTNITKEIAGVNCTKYTFAHNEITKFIYVNGDIVYMHGEEIDGVETALITIVETKMNSDISLSHIAPPELI